MAPKSESVEGIVLRFVNEQNRPLNSQNVADALQKYNLKKTAVQKALDSLSDSGRISFKEYGKQKIYIARQDQFSIPNAEELEHMKKENSMLQEELDRQNKACNEVEAEIRVLQSNLTFEEILARESKLKLEVTQMEEKLKILREGTTLVSPEERKNIEVMFSEKVKQWRKRKRIFKDLWDAITENSPKNPKEFKVVHIFFFKFVMALVLEISSKTFLQEELGIEYDEDVGEDLQSTSELSRPSKKMRAY